MGILGHGGAPAATPGTPPAATPPAPGTPAVPGAATPGVPGTPTTPAAPAHNHEPGRARRIFELVVSFLLLPSMMLFAFLFWFTRDSRAQLLVLIGAVVGIAVAFMAWVWVRYHDERRPIDHPVAPAPPADPSVYCHMFDAHGVEWQWPAGATAWQRYNGHAWV